MRGTQSEEGARSIPGNTTGSKRGGALKAASAAPSWDVGRLGTMEAGGTDLGQTVHSMDLLLVKILHLVRPDVAIAIQVDAIEPVPAVDKPVQGVRNVAEELVRGVRDAAQGPEGLTKKYGRATLGQGGQQLACTPRQSGQLDVTHR